MEIKKIVSENFDSKKLSKLHKINIGFGYRIFEIKYFKEYLFQLQLSFITFGCLWKLSSIMFVEIKLSFHILFNKVYIWNLRLL